MTVPTQRNGDSTGVAGAGELARPAVRTPNAERYLLQSEDLRRRQLRSALLHGSSRVWRERRRIWPALLVGLVVAAVIVAAIGVYGAFQQQQEIDQNGSVAQARDLHSGTALPGPPDW